MMEQDSPRGKAAEFSIFRSSSARPCDLMSYDTPTTPVEGGVDLSVLENLDQGSDLTVLFDKPGLSLVSVWFKSGYPLPRHSHNVDCVYYIVGGSVRMGEEVLGPGDGFFVGSGVPYTYTVGPEGVHLLEFRAANAFDIKLFGNMAAAHRKSIETISRRQEDWASETRPPA